MEQPELMPGQRCSVITKDFRFPAAGGWQQIFTQVYKSEQFQLTTMRTMHPRMASDGRQGLVPGLGRVGLAPLAVSKFTSAAKPRHANTSN